jgi:hypothetical protein
MKSNAGDSPFSGFGRVIFSIADHRMADRGKLDPDLILQSSDQGHSDQGSRLKRPLKGILKFGASRSTVALFAQLLKHSLPPKIVDQCSLFCLQVPTNDGKVLPHRIVGKKLSYQGIPGRLSFCEQQHARGEAIYAMDN